VAPPRVSSAPSARSHGAGRVPRRRSLLLAIPCCDNRPAAPVRPAERFSAPCARYFSSMPRPVPAPCFSLRRGVSSPHGSLSFLPCSDCAALAVAFGLLRIRSWSPRCEIAVASGVLTCLLARSPYTVGVLVTISKPPSRRAGCPSLILTPTSSCPCNACLVLAKTPESGPSSFSRSSSWLRSVS
jgi:hypothetical protein